MLGAEIHLYMLKLVLKNCWLPFQSVYSDVIIGDGSLTVHGKAVHQLHQFPSVIG